MVWGEKNTNNATAYTELKYKSELLHLKKNRKTDELNSKQN